MTLGVSRIDWRPCWRILPSRFPPVPLFERVAKPADLDAVLEAEALTNPRARTEVGALHLVAPEERVSGPGTSVIMAAFTHVNPEGSRFSDGSYGVFYAGWKLETAVAESKHHREGFLRATGQGATEVDMKAYGLDLVGDLHDLRGRRADYPEVYAARDHTAGRRLAAGLREDGSYGIAYDSVRDPGGECAAVFRPKPLSRVRRTRHLCFVWDGREIAWIYEKRFLSAGSGRLSPVAGRARERAGTGRP